MASLLLCFPTWELGSYPLLSSEPQDSKAPQEDPGGWRQRAQAGALTCCSPQVKDCTDHAVLPMDGATLAEVMRQRGINMRYLGKVLDLVLRSPARDQLDHIYVSGAEGGL